MTLRSLQLLTVICLVGMAARTDAATRVALVGSGGDGGLEHVVDTATALKTGAAELAGRLASELGR
jgi:hypothetical protein